MGTRRPRSRSHLDRHFVVLGHQVEALNFFEVRLGDEPALSNSEVFYHRMLSNDSLEGVEHAKTFMAEHSLSHYYDQVTRPALALAHQDVVRGVVTMRKSRPSPHGRKSHRDIVLNTRGSPRITAPARRRRLGSSLHPG